MIKQSRLKVNCMKVIQIVFNSLGWILQVTIDKTDVICKFLKSITNSLYRAIDDGNNIK